MTNKEASEILLDMANELQLIPESKQGQAFKIILKLLDNENVLDKISTEIEQRPYGIANESVIRGMQYERAEILEIIDKYRK